MGTASAARARGVGLFSCCPLGLHTISVSVSREPCLGHGASWDGGGALLGAHSNVTAGPMGQARGPSGLWLKPWIGGQHLGLSLGLGTAQRMDHVAGKSSSLPAASIHSPWPRNPAREAQPFPRTHAGAGSPVTTGKGIVAAESKLNAPQENPPAPARGPGQAVSPSLGADP